MIENLFDGDFFADDLSAEKIPENILNLIEPDFAMRFEIIPVAFESDDTLYFATAKENFSPLNLFTLYNVEKFLSEKFNLNCRILSADSKNIQNALEKFYNFSDDALKKSLIKFYDFDRLNFNDYGEILDWAKKNNGRVLKNSLTAPPLSDFVEQVLNLVPSNIAINYSLIPLELEENGILFLATSSSRTFECAKYFSEILHFPCRIFLTLDENIRAALEKFYHFDGLTKKFAKHTEFDSLIHGTFVDWTFLDRKFSPEIIEKVPLNVALKFQLIPLGFDSEHNFILVTSSRETLLLRNKISEILNADCKIFIADSEHFSDALQRAYNFEKIFPEPLGQWANLRYKFLLSYRPEFLLELKNSDEYENYFEKFQADSIERLNFLVQLQLVRDNVSDDDVGLIENVRANCREILTEEICQ